jgi:hypothetical protein
MRCRSAAKRRGLVAAGAGADLDDGGRSSSGSRGTSRGFSSASRRGISASRRATSSRASAASSGSPHENELARLRELASPAGAPASATTGRAGGAPCPARQSLRVAGGAGVVRARARPRPRDRAPRRDDRGGSGLLPVLLPEALDAASRVDELLLAGEERVAGGADVVWISARVERVSKVLPQAQRTLAVA